MVGYFTEPRKVLKPTPADQARAETLVDTVKLGTKVLDRSITKLSSEWLCCDCKSLVCNMRKIVTLKAT